MTRTALVIDSLTSNVPFGTLMVIMKRRRWAHISLSRIGGMTLKGLDRWGLESYSCYLSQYYENAFFSLKLTVFPKYLRVLLILFSL